MRSNFSQPPGAAHQGVFPHAYSPTDEEMLARARAWLAAGGTLVRTEGEGHYGPVVCWHVRTAEGVTLEGLPGQLATTLANYGDLERTEKGEQVTLFKAAGTVMVYVGDRPGRAFREEVRRRGWGIMSISGRPTPGFAWAFDNGAYGWAREGRPFQVETYRRRLETAQAAPTLPAFAVTPDVPQLETSDGLASLAFSLKWRPSLPASFRWYLAVQDGMTPEIVEPHLGGFSGLFLGGSNAFKATAATWVGLARSSGLAFHYARCSTVTRMAHAIAVGADSCDSSQMLRRRSEFRRATGAYYGGMAQGRLAL